MNTDPINISTADNPVGRFMVAAGAVIELNSTKKNSDFTAQSPTGLATLSMGNQLR
ncbi:hypothetical protein HY214_00440 [Candidatus Roizmanbacteria bacterium]|nr:hypothetical protein [Candidatus Roizmanbacteria bacterium]